MSSEKRIFGRAMATELTQEEIEKISGGYVSELVPGEGCKATTSCVVDDMDSGMCRMALDDC